MQISHWKDELLACGEEMPDELFDRILARGEAARETLLAVATEPLYRGDDSPGEPDAPFHALELLAEMPPDDATAARLVASILDDPDCDEADAAGDALGAMPSVAAPRLIAALATATDADAARVLSTAFVQCDVRDENAFATLSAAFERFPFDVAQPLGVYGDDRALPALHRVLDATFVGRGTTRDVERGVVDVGDAILALRGELTEEQTERHDLAIDRSLRRELRAARSDGDDASEPPPGLPGRNDPCPCGSGRKFKMCCESTVS